MDYSRIYNHLICKAQTRAVINGYKEKHHIVPRCMGGTNNETNLVCLTAREHLVAHMLLDKIYPNNYKIFFALWSMLTMKNNSMKRIFNSREYEKAKIRLRHEISKINKGSIRPRSAEHQAKITKSLIGRTVHESTKIKIREARKNQIITDKTRAKLSAAGSGSNNHFFGKTHSDHTKAKISAGNASSKKVSCDGVIYNSITEASTAYGFKRYETTRKRCLSDKYPDWFFV